MSFWMVQILSAAGVAAVIALTWAVGWGRRATVGSVEDAAQRFLADFPADVKRGAVAQDGRAAILELGDGFGIVTVLGDELVTRMVRARDIAAVKPDGGILIIALYDPTLPRVRLTLDGDEMAQWGKTLSSPASGGGVAKRRRGNVESVAIGVP